MVYIFGSELSIKFVCKWTTCCSSCSAFDIERVIRIPVNAIDDDIPAVTLDVSIFCLCNANIPLISFLFLMVSPK